MTGQGFFFCLTAAIAALLLVAPGALTQGPVPCGEGQEPFFNGAIWSCKPKAAAAVPTGLIAFSESVGCPAGWKPATQFAGKAIVAATAGDANTTGGADSVTPSGSVSPHAGQEVIVLPVATGTLGAVTMTLAGDHSFTGQALDNRPAFIRLTACRKS